MSSTTSDPTTNEILADIAKQHLGIEGLVHPSFPDHRRSIMYIWEIRKALEAAFDAGAASTTTAITQPELTIQQRLIIEGLESLRTRIASHRSIPKVTKIDWGRDIWAAIDEIKQGAKPLDHILAGRDWLTALDGSAAE